MDTKKREPISKKDLLEWRLQDLDLKEASKKYDWSISALRNAELFHGISLPKKSPRAKVKLAKKINPRLEELKELVEDGLNCNQAAQRMNLTYDTVWNMAKHNGITFSNNAEDLPESHGSASLLYGSPKEIKELLVNKAWK
jgi:hypothetical protein